MASSKASKASKAVVVAVATPAARVPTPRVPTPRDKFNGRRNTRGAPINALFLAHPTTRYTMIEIHAGLTPSNPLVAEYCKISGKNTLDAISNHVMSLIENPRRFECDSEAGKDNPRPNKPGIFRAYREGSKIWEYGCGAAFGLDDMGAPLLVAPPKSSPRSRKAGKK